MCTVTFLPLSDRILITSSRDEKTSREVAELPEAVEFKSGKILYPRDGKAGGTWIAMHNNGNVMVLLNGGFKAHVPLRAYRKSRGLIFLDIFDGAYPVNIFQSIDLSSIESFTLVILQHDQLFECRWDGAEKYITPLPVDVPRIWSSVTLYDEPVRMKRKQWFEKWLNKKQFITADQVIHFHEFAGEGDERNSLRMSRDGILHTVSITGIEITQDKAIMRYKDLHGGLLSVNEWFIASNMISV